MNALETAGMTPEQKRELLTRLLAERSHEPDRRPLSYAQHRLWFLDQLEPDSPVYNISSAVRLEGPLDVAALRRSLDGLVARHQTLRTWIETVEGEGLQRIEPAGPAPLEVVDLTTLGTNGRAAAEKIAARDALRPFDLGRGPLLRVTLAVLGPQEHVLVVTMHHIVSDGLSMEIFTRELVDLYGSERQARPARLAPLPIQYADFAAWQRRELGAGGRLARQLAYWRDKLAGVETYLELPAARPREGVRPDRGRRQSRVLGAERLASLRRLARLEGTTLFVVVLSALQVAISDLTGRREFLVGVPFAGRNRTELEGLIGFLLNLVPLRADLQGDPTLREILRRTQQTTLEAQENQDAPFEAIVEELGLRRDPSRSPLVQITCDIQTAPPPASASIGELRLGPLTAATAGSATLAQFDLSLNALVLDRRMPMHLTYRSDLYGEATVSQLFDRLEQVLAAAEHPEARLSELAAALDAAERDRQRRREREARLSRHEKFGRLRGRSEPGAGPQRRRP